MGRKYKQKIVLHNTARQKGVFRIPGVFRSLIYSLDIFWEFLMGFRFMSHFGKAVSFFGSARESLPEHYYADCEELAARLSTQGFAIITGGSGGIMQAANRGANRVNGESVGVNIRIPNEQQYNKFLKHFGHSNIFLQEKLSFLVPLRCMSFSQAVLELWMSFLKCLLWCRSI